MKFMIFAPLAVMLATSSVYGGANLLVNGDFENEPNFITAPNDSGSTNGANSGDGGYELMTGNAIPGWTIVPGFGATIHREAPGYAYNYYSVIDGTYSLNTDGEGYNGQNVIIYQDFASTAGATYNFSFKWGIWNYLNNGGSANLEILVFDTVNTNDLLFYANYPDTNPNEGTDPKYPSTLPYNLVNASFLGTGNNIRVQIDENPMSGYNDNQFIVDDFSVTSVPEPSTLALLGLASVVLLRRGRESRRS